MKTNLRRFGNAQSASYESVLIELQNGKKVGHWVWFIFPQIRGLGSSPTSQCYAIQNREEAAAYLADPILGQRLIECTEILLSLKGFTAEEIFGHPDNLKLRSSLTLFDFVSSEGNVFSRALQKYYQGQKDIRTLHLLEQEKN